METLDVQGIKSIESIRWSADREERTGWIESNDGVDDSEPRVLSSDTSHVSSETEPDDTQLAVVQQIVLAKEIEVRSEENSNRWNPLSRLDIGDESRTLRPVDEDDVEVVHVEKESRCLHIDVTGAVFEPAVDQDSRRLVGVEGTLLDAGEVTESKLDGGVAVCAS